MGTQFAMAFNHNVSSALTGQNVAQNDTDATFQSALKSNLDPRFVVGFFIGSGIFGDQRFGGQGERNYGRFSPAALVGAGLNAVSAEGFTAAREAFGVRQ